MDKIYLTIVALSALAACACVSHPPGCDLASIAIVDRGICKKSERAGSKRTVFTSAHGGLRIMSGLDDGDPDGTPGNGELEDGEVELDRKVCLAPTEELVVGDTGQCSVTAPGASGPSSALPLALLLGLAGVLVRSQKRSCRR